MKKYEKTEKISKEQVELEEVIFLIQDAITRNQSVQFCPQGTSMLPMLRPGVDSVVLSRVPDKLKKYDLVLYQRDNGQYILHRIVGVKDTYICAGDNQLRCEKGVRHEQMIARVTSFCRGEKVHDVNEITYQLYCHVRVCRNRICYFYVRVRNKMRRMFISRKGQ